MALAHSLPDQPANDSDGRQLPENVLPMKGRRETYTTVSNAILDMDLDPYELAVYMAIARQDFAGSTGRQPLSQSELMASAHLKERRGVDALNSLRRKGLVVAESSGGHRFVYKRAENANAEAIKSAPRAEKTAQTGPKSLHHVQDISAPRAGKTAPRAEPSLLNTKDTKDTTANAVGADAPPTAQNHAPSPPSEKPATTSAPYVIAEALLTAQNRVPTRARCLEQVKRVKEHVTDAYREHPQKPGTADALACIAYLLTDPYIAGDVGRLTPQFLGSQLGPWLKAGKPARWADPKTRRGKAPPSQVSPPSGVDPRLVALDPRLERWAAARKEERDRYHEAHKHELGGP